MNLKWAVYVLVAIILAAALYQVLAVNVLNDTEVVETKLGAFTTQIGTLTDQLIGIEQNLCAKILALEAQVQAAEVSSVAEIAASEATLTSQVQASQSDLVTQVQAAETTMTAQVNASQVAVVGAIDACEVALAGDITSAQTVVSNQVTASKNAVVSQIQASAVDLVQSVQAAQTTLTQQTALVESVLTALIAAIQATTATNLQAVVDASELDLQNAVAASQVAVTTALDVAKDSAVAAVEASALALCAKIQASQAVLSNELSTVLSTVALDSVFLTSLQNSIAGNLATTTDFLCEKLVLLLDDAGIIYLNPLAIQETGSNPTTFSFLPVSTNPGGGALTYVLTRVDTGQGTVLPLGHSFNPLTGEFSWEEQTGPVEYTLHLQVTDVLSNTSSQTVVLTRTPDPPVLAPLTVVATTAGFPETFTITPVVTDPGGGSLVFALACLSGPLPVGHSFNTSTGEFSWAEQGATGSFQLEITVTDANFQTDVKSVLLVRPDVFPPVVSAVPLQEVEHGNELVFTVVADDTADGHAVTFALSGSFPSGVDPVFATTGEFKWTPSPADVGPHAFDVDVSDGYQTTTVPVQIIVHEPLSIAPPGAVFSLGTDEHRYVRQAVITGQGPLEIRSTVSVAGQPSATRPVVVDPQTGVIRAHDVDGYRLSYDTAADPFSVTVSVYQPSTGNEVFTVFQIQNMGFFVPPTLPDFKQLPTQYWPANDNGFTVPLVTYSQTLPTVTPVITATIGGVPTSDVHLWAMPRPQISFLPNGLYTPAPTFAGFPAGTVIDVEVDPATPGSQTMTFQIVIVPDRTLQMFPIPDYTFPDGGPINYYPPGINLPAPRVIGVPPYTFSMTSALPDLHIDPVNGQVYTPAFTTYWYPGYSVAVTVSVTDSTGAGPVSQTFTIHDMVATYI